MVSQTWPCRWWHHHPRTTSWLWLVQAWRCSSWWVCSAEGSPNVSLRSWRTGRPRPLWGQDTPTGENDHDWTEPPPSFTPSLYGPESSTRLLPFATSVLLTLLLPLLEWHYPQSYCRKWAWSVTHLLYFYMRPAHSPRGHAHCRLLFFIFFSSWASLQSTGFSCSFTPLSPDVDADAVLHHFISPPPFCLRVRRGSGVVRIRGQRSRCWSEGGEWNQV